MHTLIDGRFDRHRIPNDIGRLRHGTRGYRSVLTAVLADRFDLDLLIEE